MNYQPCSKFGVSLFRNVIISVISHVFSFFSNLSQKQQKTMNIEVKGMNVLHIENSFAFITLTLDTSSEFPPIWFIMDGNVYSDMQ